MRNCKACEIIDFHCGETNNKIMSQRLQNGASKVLVLITVVAIGGVIFFGFLNARNNANKSEETPATQGSVSPSITGAPANTTVGPTSVTLKPEEQVIKDISSNGVPACAIANSCKVEFIKDKFARGTISQGFWIAVFRNGTWRAVVTGNDFPKCEDIDKNYIPTEFYQNCMEAGGELRY